MTLRLIRLFVFSFMCSWITPTIANDSIWPAYEIPRSIVRTITSENLGRSYELYIKLPPNFHDEVNKARRYPVLYLNDGTYCFQTAAGITHMPMNSGGFEHAILVGVSYAKGEAGVASRSRDLTPTIPKNLNEGHGAKYEHGGAAEYLAFLRDEVVPFVEREYRGDPSRRILVGQSYGGLFGAYVLVTDPTAFTDYILTSSSLWHNESVMFDFEKKFAASNTKMPARVYFAIGEMETNPGRERNMVEDQTRFADTLRSRNYEGLEVRDIIIPSATHKTTFPIGLTKGLMWMLEGPNP